MVISSTIDHLIRQLHYRVSGEGLWEREGERRRERWPRGPAATDRLVTAVAATKRVWKVGEVWWR
jgi:hypothetical protein